MEAGREVEERQPYPRNAKEGQQLQEAGRCKEGALSGNFRGNRTLLKPRSSISGLQAVVNKFLFF